MKILINTPSLKLLGGVANHYLGLKDYWTEDVKYNTVGKRSHKSSSGLLWLPFDIVKFIFRLLSFRPDVVLLNPSLGKSALKRDFIFLSIANKMRFKVVIFIHGFDWDYAKTVDKHWVSTNLNNASLILVLANAIKETLYGWSVSVPIALTTTKVNGKILDGYLPSLNRTGKVFNILFLSRIEKTKGIFIAIDSYNILKRQYHNLQLTIAGDGNDLENAKEYVKKNNIHDVIFTGRLDGKAVAEAYINADIYSFPSYYGEGMPTSVLEAMAFGLPVFTRNVGGLVDFFENGKMGYISDSLDASDFAKAIVPYIEDAELTRKVSIYNAEYAKSHFMASQVAKNIEQYCKQIQNEPK